MVCESGTWVGTYDGKNRRSKIGRNCPFKNNDPWSSRHEDFKQLIEKALVYDSQYTYEVGVVVYVHVSLKVNDYLKNS